MADLIRFVPLAIRQNVISSFFLSFCTAAHERRLQDGARLFGRIAQCTRGRPTAEHRRGATARRPPSSTSRKTFFLSFISFPSATTAARRRSERLPLLDAAATAAFCCCSHTQARAFFRECRRVVCAVFVLCRASREGGCDEILTLAPEEPVREKLLSALYPIALRHCS